MHRRLAPLLVAMLIATAALAPVSAAAAGGPAAHWTFDETNGAIANDTVGTLDGAIQGATSTPDGMVGRAFHFDGADRVTFPDAPSLRADMLTVDFWVRGDPSAPPTDGQVLLDKGSMLCGGSGYAMVVDGRFVSVIYRDLRDSTGVQTLRVNPVVNLPTVWDGRWHHISFGGSTRADGWGGVGFRVDGWSIGGTTLGTVEGIDYGDDAAAPLAIGGSDDACGPGFVGDIDQVRVFDAIIPTEVLDADEPTVQSTLRIDSVAPTEVSKESTVDVTLAPFPPRSGRFRVHVTPDDGTERVVGALDVTHWSQIDPDGRYQVRFTTDYGGASVVRVVFEPTYAIPYLASESSKATTIAKRSSSTTIGRNQTYIAAEPIQLGVTVRASTSTKATGVAELYERTSSGLTLIHSQTLPNLPGSADAGFNLSLPGRSAGTYEFEARYLGGPAYLPSTSVITAVTVEPALQAGPVVINGGAATTADPIVTVAVPAIGATGLWISTDPNDIRRFWTQPYTPEITTWLTAPWYGDDADGVRTIWIKWADALGRWSEMQSASIILDRNGTTPTPTPTPIPTPTPGLDTVAPTTTAPGRAFVSGSALASGSITLRIPWSGSDAGSGIARHELQQQTDGGAWTTVSTTLTSPTLNRALATQHTYRFRVRAVDRAGNVGAWATGSTFRLSRFSEGSASIRYTGTWARSRSSAYWGGVAKASSRAGATASLTFSGRSIAFVSRRGPGRGQAQIYVNGVKVATVDLRAATYQNQRVVWAGSWSTAASRRVTVRVVGTSGRPRVDFDAFVTAN